jgi:hypothetical protein
VLSPLVAVAVPPVAVAVAAAPLHTIDLGKIVAPDVSVSEVNWGAVRM